MNKKNISEVLVTLDIIIRFKAMFWGHNFRYISKQYQISISQCSARYPLSNKLLSTSYKKVLVKFLLS